MKEFQKKLDKTGCLCGRFADREMVQATLCMRGGSLVNEIMDYFGIREDLAATSAEMKALLRDKNRYKYYAMRRGIETSFRVLKHTVGLQHFHAKKVDSVHQEIFARPIMYNFYELITRVLRMMVCRRIIKIPGDFI